MASRELLSLSLYSLLASNRGGLFIVFLPLYLVELKGASLPVALAILALAYIPASLIGPLVGRLSDRAGRRRPYLLLGEAMAFPLFLAVTFAPGYALAGAFFIAAELALAIGGPAYTAYVADVTRAGERGAGDGLLNATSSAGGVVGVILAGVITFEFGLIALFPFVIAVMIGTLSVVIFLIPDIHVPATPARSSSPGDEAGHHVLVRGLDPRDRQRRGRDVLRIPRGEPWREQLRGEHRRGRGPPHGRLRLPSSRPPDRPTGEIRGIWYGTALSLASYGIFLFSSTWTETIPGQAVRNGGLALVGTGMQAWVARAAPEGHRAEYLGCSP